VDRDQIERVLLLCDWNTRWRSYTESDSSCQLHHYLKKCVCVVCVCVYIYIYIYMHNLNKLI